jgi:hypothetical protein
VSVQTQNSEKDLPFCDFGAMNASMEDKYININKVAEVKGLKALAKIDLINTLNNFVKKYPTKKEAYANFIELYNSGGYLKNIFKTIGSISRGTIYRLLEQYDGTVESLIPKINTQNLASTIQNLLLR